MDGQTKRSVQTGDRTIADVEAGIGRRNFLGQLGGATLAAIAAGHNLSRAGETKNLRVGMIGLDTSHSVAFSQLLNADAPKPELANCRVVAAYPKGSPDIESSVSRVPEYTAAVKKVGVEIVDSIEKLVGMVDCVLLESNDGRPHLEQVIPVLRAHKPVFVDKPVAGSLADAQLMYALARQHGTPMFTSSSLRYVENALNARAGKVGALVGCDVRSPCHLEATHPDLFWYGIHGVELLYTTLGPGCESVSRSSTPGGEFVVGRWNHDRIGTYRGMRSGKPDYGGTAYGTDGNLDLGGYKGYEPLVREIVTFFRTGNPPVDAAESLEIYAFMEGADESKRRQGAQVSLNEVVDLAKQQARKIAQERKLDVQV